jgi:hypothetical protein
MTRRLTLKASDLPIEIELVGEKGEKRYFTLRPAGRKFGALLCAVEKHSAPLPNQGGQNSAA